MSNEQTTDINCYKLDLEDLGNYTIVKRSKKEMSPKNVEFKPLIFNQKNLSLILACIDIDSTYRRSFDENNQDSSAYYIKKHFGNKSTYEKEYLQKSNEEKLSIIKEVCMRVDKENATHLSVSSLESNDQSGNTKIGIEKMAEYIVKECNDILDVLKSDVDSSIVDRLSMCVIDQIRKDKDGNDIVLNKLSFASKFCTYMCRYAFAGKDRDKFSIYDSVLCSILPYYMWKYREHVGVKLTKDMLTKTGKNSIANLTKVEHYKWYRDIITDIIKGINKENPNLNINRENFDLMLWYYYKGDSDLISASYAYLKEQIK